jgi:hypothetical protein
MPGSGMPGVPDNPLYGDLPGQPSNSGGVAATSGGSVPAWGGWMQSTLINPVWEYISRAILLFCGFMLVFIAIIALLWQSKTVQVGARTLAGVAE